VCARARAFAECDYDATHPRSLAHETHVAPHAHAQADQPAFESKEDIVLFVQIILAQGREAAVATAFDFVREMRDTGLNLSLLYQFYEASDIVCTAASR
jgi:hypothetical protein